MSDHLCSMNETLTKQREEIDTLKMTSKVSCQVLTLGTGCSLEVYGLHLAFLQYYPSTNQFTNSSSYSRPIGKKTPNLVLHISVNNKFLQNIHVGKNKHCMSLLQSRLSKRMLWWKISTFFVYMWWKWNYLRIQLVILGVYDWLTGRSVLSALFFQLQHTLFLAAILLCFISVF